MNEKSNSEIQEGIDPVVPTEELEDYPLGQFGLDEPDDEEHCGLCPDDTVSLFDMYRDGSPYTPKTISELEAEDIVEKTRPIYSQGDRILSENQIRDKAEKMGVVIGNDENAFIKYCSQNNINLIEKYQPKNNIELVEKSSSPEQRAKLAKLALALINAVDILKYAHMTTGDISAEVEADKHVKRAITLQKDLNGEEHDEASVEAAVQQFKDELVARFIGPDNVANLNTFLEKQNKIKDDYNQEVRDSLKKNPNFNVRKWHKN